MEITPALIERVDDELRCIHLNDRFKFVKAQLDKIRPEATFRLKDKDFEEEIEIRYSIPRKFFGEGPIEDIETMINICKNINLHSKYRMQTINISTLKVRAEYYNKEDGTSIRISTLRWH